MENDRPIGNRIFLGPRGLRAGWRLLIFLVIVFAVSGIFAWLVHGWNSRDFRVVAGDAGLLAGICAGMWAMSLIEKKSFWTFGLQPAHAVSNAAMGLVCGFTGLSVLIGLLMAAGVCRFGAPALQGGEAVRWGLYWVVMFLLVGFAEELLTRGYPLYALSQGIGFWPSAVLLSLFFGAGHLGNSGEQMIGIANAVLAGVVFTYSLWWSGSLWWAIGCHMSWDWAETYFYGVADSGVVSPHHFLSAEPVGPAWLSGGSVGPEGSVLAIVVLLLMGLAARRTTPRMPLVDWNRFQPAPAAPPAPEMLIADDSLPN